MTSGKVRVFVLEGFRFEYEGAGLEGISDKDKTRHGRGRDVLRYLAFVGDQSIDLTDVAAVLLDGHLNRKTAPSDGLGDAISAWTKVFGGQSLKQRIGDRQVLRIPQGVWVDHWAFRDRLVSAAAARQVQDALTALGDAARIYERSARLAWEQRGERSGRDGNRHKDARHPDPLQAYVLDYRQRLVQAYIDYATLSALTGELVQAYSALEGWTSVSDDRPLEQQLPGVFDQRLWRTRLAVASKVGQAETILRAYSQLPKRLPERLAPSDEEGLEIFCRGFWGILLERAAKYSCWRELTVHPRYATSVARIVPEMTRVDNAMSQLADERDRSSERIAFWVLGDPQSTSMVDQMLQVLINPSRSLVARFQAAWSIDQMEDALRIRALESINRATERDDHTDGVGTLLADALAKRRVNEVIGEITQDSAKDRALRGEVKRLEKYRQSFRRDVSRRDQQQGPEVGVV